MRALAAAVIAVVCAVVAGCGSGATAARSAPARSPAGGSAAAGSVPASSPGHCRGLAALAAGHEVGAWRLGVLQFTSAAAGVALTAARIPCDIPLGPGQGTEVSFQPQPVLLAASRDGGRHWVISGRPLPGGGTGPMQVAAVAGRGVWVLNGAGTMLATSDDGATWVPQPLPGPVLSAASSGGWLWALSCPPAGAARCHPVVVHRSLTGGAWARTNLAVPLSFSGDLRLTVLSGRDAAVVLADPGAALASTTDGGVTWSVRRSPAANPRLCEPDDPGLLAAASPEDWWLLCTGGAAAGSSTKALFRSLNAGRTWSQVSAITSLTAPAKPGSLPYQDFITRAAAAPDRLWILTPNTFSGSKDGGERGARVLHLLDRTPWLFPVFCPSGRRIMRRDFSPSAFGVRRAEDSAQRLRLDMTRCYYLDTLTTLGIPELTGLYCHGDEVMYGGLGHIRFVRAGTLAQGCDRCDFCFERRPTGGQRSVQGAAP